MSQTNRYILLGVAILAILGLFVYLRQDPKKRFDWNETYKENSKEPFGAYVIHESLKSYFPNKKLEDLKSSLAQTLPTDSLKEAANYIFLGDGYFPDTADVDKLLVFVQEGNRAFVAANAMPNYFLERIFKDSCLDEDSDVHTFRSNYIDSANLNLKHPQLIENQGFKYYFEIEGERKRYDWSYIDTVRGECTEGATNAVTPIGFLNDEDLNFVRIGFGKGAIFLHSNPIVFSNFHLLDSAKMRYAAKAFSHLPTGDIYWDTKNRTSRDVVNRVNGSNSKMSKDSPLKYVLAQPSLRWAWFILLGLVGLYFIFIAKRRQRIIPVLEDKSNTSLDFVQTIGHMYFRQGEHARLCDMMLKQFQTFVRERYHLASRKMDVEFTTVLAAKSDVPADRIKRIIEYERKIEMLDITENSMVDFHYLLNNFYKSCK